MNINYERILIGLIYNYYLQKHFPNIINDELYYSKIVGTSLW